MQLVDDRAWTLVRLTVPKVIADDEADAVIAALEAVVARGSRFAGSSTALSDRRSCVLAAETTYRADPAYGRREPDGCRGDGPGNPADRPGRCRVRGR